jgi:type VI secretion system protein ImpK
VVLAAVYIALTLSLSSMSDRIAADAAMLRVKAPDLPAPPPKKAAEPRLAGFLAPEIRQGLVAVDDRADRSIVTIVGDGLFKAGEATVRPEDVRLISRIAEELTKVPGQVEVIGYTDNQPIRTLRFPSNWELSRARADSVARLIAVRIPGSRITADGRGEADPVAPNDTPQGRAKNRRVEITVYVPAGGAAEAAPGGSPRRP